MVFEPGQELEDFGNLFDFAMANALALAIYHRRHAMPCDAMRCHAPKDFSTLAPEHWYRKHAASPVYLLLCIAVGEVALPADAKHPWRATGGRKLLQQALGTTGSESE